MPVFELDAKQRLKVNPLASWTRKESWTYAFKHDVIYNPLHDQGYASIGDEPITTPVADGEDERAGRWRGTGKLECGIHI
jgi:phosphoadenosine phosphosulfate reductase